MKRAIELKLASPRSEPLVIKLKDLHKKTATLFERLERDTTLRERFVSNPTGHLVGEVLGYELPKQQLSDANRLLFATLANEKFLAWLDAYDPRPQGGAAPSDKFAKDFAEAVLKFGDGDLLIALLRQSKHGHGIPGLGGEVFQQFVTGPEKTFVTPAATPSTSDQTLKSSQNFNGISLGADTAVNPAVLRALVSQLIAHAKELKAQGVLADLETVVR